MSIFFEDQNNGISKQSNYSCLHTTKSITSRAKVVIKFYGQYAQSEQESVIFLPHKKDISPNLETFKTKT
jgi:hypothetical protein